MSKYELWIQTALEKLDKDFCSKVFLPRNEYDIQSHLWHCLMVTRDNIKGLGKNYQITRDFNLKETSEKVDLVLVKSSTKDPMNEYEVRVLIEVKETSTDKLLDSHKTGLKTDIDKMRKIKQDYIERKSKGYKNIIDSWLIFYCRDASEGITLSVNEKLRMYNEKYPDINFWWGPKCIK